MPGSFQSVLYLFTYKWGDGGASLHHFDMTNKMKGEVHQGNLWDWAVAS